MEVVIILSSYLGLGLITCFAMLVWSKYEKAKPDDEVFVIYLALWPAVWVLISMLLFFSAANKAAEWCARKLGAK